jgi:hypothetical protein
MSLSSHAATRAATWEGVAEAKAQRLSTAKQNAGQVDCFGSLSEYPLTTPLLIFKLGETAPSISAGFKVGKPCVPARC